MGTVGDYFMHPPSACMAQMRQTAARTVRQPPQPFSPFHGSNYLISTAKLSRLANTVNYQKLLTAEAFENIPLCNRTPSSHSGGTEEHLSERREETYSLTNSSTITGCCCCCSFVFKHGSPQSAPEARCLSEHMWSSTSPPVTTSTSIY